MFCEKCRRKTTSLHVTREDGNVCAGCYGKNDQEYYFIMKHFEKYEFNCRCCGENEMKRDFLDRLDAAREKADIPFIVTSGYRCPKHDKAVSGGGNHPKGIAADIKTTNSCERLKILKALLDVGFERIGIGKTFIHVDQANKPSAIQLYQEKNK